ncbi:MAG: hypothetical protein Q8Q14_06365 [Gemmatimonadales bacterium]|nr:hypothetical protein [Gemmatimonadales bacterium]
MSRRRRRRAGPQIVAQNAGMVDEWTAGHAFVGAIAGAAGVGPWWLAGGMVAYEVGEQFVERTAWGQRAFGTGGPETLLNVAGDSLAMAAAYCLARRLR